MNWKKLRRPPRATLTNPNYKLFRELEKKLKYSPRTIFRNRNFESKDEWKKTMSRIEFHC